MAHRRAWGAAAAAAMATALLVTLTPSEGSRAQWRESAARSVSGPSSDTFDMAAADVPDTSPTPWPNGRMATSPRVTVTNQSARHSSWINVRSTRVDRVVPEGGATPVTGMSLGYGVGSGSCAGVGQADYWQARGAGQVTPGTTYRRASGKVAAATITPGQSRTLCPVVGFSTGARQTLLNHAGRAFDITTVVDQRSEAPASWDSPDRTVTSRYRIAMPTPVKPAGWNVCRTTTSSGNPDSILPKYYGGFFWGWPDAATASFDTPPSTPAMAGGWDIMRRTSQGTWEVWKSVPAGSERRSAGHNSRDIDPERDVIREFKLRGYPFAGNKDRYVESAWIARAENDWSLLTDRWECHPPLPNPNAGPHNMP